MSTPRGQKRRRLRRLRQGKCVWIRRSLPCRRKHPICYPRFFTSLVGDAFLSPSLLSVIYTAEGGKWIGRVAGSAQQNLITTHRRLADNCCDAVFAGDGGDAGPSREVFEDYAGTLIGSRNLHVNIYGMEMGMVYWGIRDLSGEKINTDEHG